MKFLLSYIITVFFIIQLSAQQNDYLRKVDSLQKHVLTSQVKDSILIASVHYNIGELYRYSFLGDSAYYHYHKAEKIYKSLEAKFQLAKTLYGIAVVQKEEKDFTGSELTSVEAILLLESLEESNDVKKYRSFIYNNLGIVFDELGQFDQAIKYYNQSLKLKQNLKGDFKSSIYNTLNNLADSFSRFGQYSLAISKYQEILEDENLINEGPDFYAMVLDNYAHTLYLSKDLDRIPNLYLRALKISDSINNGGYNSIIINQHLAEYYNDNNIIDSARYYAYRAKNIAERYNNDDLLKSLLLLSKIEEGDLAVKHLEEYVKLSDSLQKNERATRDKFARIRFETNQKEQENIQLSRERTWLLIISVVLIIASFLIYVIINQRNKNKELRFIQQQQETNEEIYNLMLSQNDKIEEARTLEKKRISEELHDGVLGRLFGTRLSLDSLNMGTSVEAINTRGQYITELKTIEEDIRKVSHELNTDFVSGSGFIDIIKTLIENQTKAYGFKYKLTHDDIINWEEASNKTKIHIYRIIQESLQNIYKHANATLVKISFEMKKTVFCLTISDNGAGFDVSKAKKGIGIKNITSRVNEIKGDLTINSERNKGTTLVIEVNTE